MRQKKKGYWTKEHCIGEARKYKNRTSFCKGSCGAYTASLKHGWLDEICSHMEVRWQKKWDTKEKCAKEAIKYESKTEFQKHSPGVWKAANKNGWLDEICSHMEFRWQRKWDTKEKCAKEAIKYKSKTEFQKHSPGAWKAANRYDWLDEICSHMVIYGNLFKRCIYAFEFSDMSVYIGLTDNIKRRERQHLKSSNSAVYKHIRKTSLIPILQILHEYTDKELAKILEEFYIEDYRNKGWNILNRAKAGSLGGKYVFWTYEECRLHALQCSTRSEFLSKYPGGYASATKNNWLDEICQHMELKFEIKNNPETVRLEAQKYKTRQEFRNGSYSAYEYARKHQLLDAICTHMSHPLPKVKWTDEAILKEAKRYSSKEEFRKACSAAYTIAHKKGIIDKACSHMLSLRKERDYWTFEQCHKAALKYQSRVEFKKKDGSAYSTAIRNKWIEQICTHMIKPVPKVKWTYKKLEEEAKRYKTKKEFELFSHSAYVTAVRNGILDEVCSHMKSMVVFRSPKQPRTTRNNQI